MRVSDASVEKLLLDAGKLKQADIKKLEEKVKKENRPLQDIVLMDNLIDEVELTKLLTKANDIP